MDMPTKSNKDGNSHDDTSLQDFQVSWEGLPAGRVDLLSGFLYKYTAELMELRPLEGFRAEGMVQWYSGTLHVGQDRSLPSTSGKIERGFHCCPSWFCCAAAYRSIWCSILAVRSLWVWDMV